MSDDDENAKKPKKGSDEQVLKQMRERFGAAANAEAENRKIWADDVDFSCSDDQWPQDIKDMRGNGRPRLTINRLNGTVKQIEGDYRQNKMSIHVLPASGDADEDVADILAGLIRNIEQQSKADQVYLQGLRYASRGGFGWMRIMPEYAHDDTFEQDLFIRPIHNPLTVYCDPKARQVTREDARYMFVAEMVDKDEFKAEYPDAKLDFIDGLDVLDDSYENWVDGDEVRLCEYFTKEYVPAKLVSFDNGAVLEIDNDAEIEALAQIGWNVKSERNAKRTQIRWRKCTGGQILEERVYKAPYIPLIPVLGEEINVSGKVLLRSAVYYGKDAQRMYNYWKTAATESVALQAKAPWLVTPEQIENQEEQWKNVNNKPQPYLVYNHKTDQPPPAPIQMPQQPAGEMAMAGGANIDIQYTTNTFDANLGQKSNETSGVAIGERQHQGTTGNFLFIDNLKTAIEHVGRVLLSYIPIVYDTERVVRVIGLEGDSSTETVNQEIKNPILGITQVLNDITIGKYDVVIEAGQAFATRRREAVEGMLKFAQVMPQQAPLIADLLIKNMDVPGGEVMAERIKRSLPPNITADPDSPEGQQHAQQAQAQQAQQQQMQQQLIQGKLAVEQGKNQASMVKSQADVTKAQAEVVKAKADTIQAVAQTHNQAAEHAADVLDNNRMASGQPATGGAGAVANPAPASPQIQLVKAPEDQQRDQLLHQAIAGIAQHLVQSGQQNQQLMQHMAGSHEALAHHMANQNAIAAAPVEAIRDKTGKIIGSRRVIQHANA